MDDKQVIMSYKEHQEWLARFDKQQESADELREKFVELRNQYDEILKDKKVVYLREFGDAIIVGKKLIVDNYRSSFYSNIYLKFPVVVGMGEIVAETNGKLKESADQLTYMRKELDMKDAVNNTLRERVDKLSIGLHQMEGLVPKRKKKKYAHPLLGEDWSRA